MKHFILLTFFALFFCGDMVADIDGSAAAQINLQHKKFKPTIVVGNDSSIAQGS